MTITYQVEDGYAGGSRPQHVEVPDDELIECENDEARRKLCDEYVEQDFQNKISWCYTNGYPDFSELPKKEEEELEEKPKRKRR